MLPDQEKKILFRYSQAFFSRLLCTASIYLLPLVRTGTRDVWRALYFCTLGSTKMYANKPTRINIETEIYFHTKSGILKSPGPKFRPAHIPNPRTRGIEARDWKPWEQARVSIFGLLLLRSSESQSMHISCLFFSGKNCRLKYVRASKRKRKRQVQKTFLRGTF